ncbi:MAG: response regulator [Acidobacteriota bacterium]
MTIKNFKGRILFVNPDLETQEMVALIVKDAGYEIISALNIGEGLALVNQANFDLILLDWFFEDGHGIDLCRQIRTQDQHTPIFFYASEGRQSEIKKAINAGAQGFFLKPVAVDHFLTTLSEYLERRII